MDQPSKTRQIHTAQEQRYHAQTSQAKSFTGIQVHNGLNRDQERTDDDQAASGL
jgi:hypothetical protein